MSRPTGSLKQKATVILVNFRSAPLAIDCLVSLELERRELHDFCVIVVDGNSQDTSVVEISAAILERGWSDWCSLCELNHNGGFAYANNSVIRSATQSDTAADCFLLLNPDTVTHNGAVGSLLRFMDQHSDVGICGSRLEDPDGSTQLAARRFPGILSELEATLRLGFMTRLLNRWKTTEPESDEPHPTDWLPGASLMIRREVFEQIGLLDDGYFMYYEEVDFCLRAKRAGWQVWYVPQSRVIHLVGQSSGVTSAGPRKRLPQYWYDSRRRYFQKNYGRLSRILTDITFILGFSCWRLRRKLQRKPDTDPPAMLRDYVTYFLTGRISAR